MNRMAMRYVTALGLIALATIPASAQTPNTKQPPAAQKSAPAGPTVAVTKSGLELDAKQVASLERVTKFFNSTATLVGKFHQIAPDGSKTEGQFYLQRPGRVRFQYDDPSPIELISDGSSVAVRNRTLATQDIYPLSQTPLRFLLAEKIDLLRDSNVSGVFQDDLFITVVITEKSSIAGSHRLMLMFGTKDNQLKQWTITDPQGYDTTVAVFDLDVKTKPDPQLFKIDFTRFQQ
jgi:outer membrane lipoprotein-sorting protein